MAGLRFLVPTMLVRIQLGQQKNPQHHAGGFALKTTHKTPKVTYSMEHVWRMCEICVEHPPCIYPVSTKYLTSSCEVLIRLRYSNTAYSGGPGCLQRRQLLLNRFYFLQRVAFFFTLHGNNLRFGIRHKAFVGQFYLNRF